MEQNKNNSNRNKLNKKFKKSLLGTTALVAAASPVATLISCEEIYNKILENDYNDNILFQEISKKHIKWIEPDQTKLPLEIENFGINNDNALINEVPGIKIEFEKGNVDNENGCLGIKAIITKDGISRKIEKTISGFKTTQQALEEIKDNRVEELKNFYIEKLIKEGNRNKFVTQIGKTNFESIEWDCNGLKDIRIVVKKIEKNALQGSIKFSVKISSENSFVSIEDIIIDGFKPRTFAGINNEDLPWIEKDSELLPSQVTFFGHEKFELKGEDYKAIANGETEEENNNKNKIFVSFDVLAGGGIFDSLGAIIIEANVTCESDTGEILEKKTLRKRITGFKNTDAFLKEVKADDFDWIKPNPNKLPSEIQADQEYGETKIDQIINKVEGFTIDYRIKDEKKNAVNNEAGILILEATISKTESGLINEEDIDEVSRTDEIKIEKTISGFKKTGTAFDSIVISDFDWIEPDITKLPSEVNDFGATEIQPQVKDIHGLKNVKIWFEYGGNHNDDQGILTVKANIEYVDKSGIIKTKPLIKTISGFKKTKKAVEDITFDQLNIKGDLTLLPSQIDIFNYNKKGVEINGVKDLVIEVTNPLANDITGELIVDIKISKINGDIFKLFEQQLIIGFKKTNDVLWELSKKDLRWIEPDSTLLPSQIENFGETIENEILIGVEGFTVTYFIDINEKNHVNDETGELTITAIVERNGKSRKFENKITGFKTNNTFLNEIKKEDLPWIKPDPTKLPSQIEGYILTNKLFKNIEGIRVEFWIGEDGANNEEGSLTIKTRISKGTALRDDLENTIFGFRTTSDAFNKIKETDLKWINGDITKLPSQITEFDNTEANPEIKDLYGLKGIKIWYIYNNHNDDEGSLTLEAKIKYEKSNNEFEERTLKKVIYGFKKSETAIENITIDDLNWIKADKNLLPSQFDISNYNRKGIEVNGLKDLVILVIESQINDDTGEIILTIKVSKNNGNIFNELENKVISGFKTTNDAIGSINNTHLKWIKPDSTKLPSEIMNFGKTLTGATLNGISGFTVLYYLENEEHVNDIAGELIITAKITKGTETRQITKTISGFKSIKDVIDKINLNDLPWMKGDSTKLPSQIENYTLENETIKNISNIRIIFKVIEDSINDDLGTLKMKALVSIENFSFEKDFTKTIYGFNRREWVFFNIKQKDIKWIEENDNFFPSEIKNFGVDNENEEINGLKGVSIEFKRESFDDEIGLLIIRAFLTCGSWKTEITNRLTGFKNTQKTLNNIKITDLDWIKSDRSFMPEQIDVSIYEKNNWFFGGVNGISVKVIRNKNISLKGQMVITIIVSKGDAFVHFENIKLSGFKETIQFLGEIKSEEIKWISGDKSTLPTNAKNPGVPITKTIRDIEVLVTYSFEIGEANNEIGQLSVIATITAQGVSVDLRKTITDFMTIYEAFESIKANQIEWNEIQNKETRFASEIKNEEFGGIKEDQTLNEVPGLKVTFNIDENEINDEEGTIKVIAQIFWREKNKTITRSKVITGFKTLYQAWIQIKEQNIIEIFENFDKKSTLPSQIKTLFEDENIDRKVVNINGLEVSIYLTKKNYNNIEGTITMDACLSYGTFSDKNIEFKINGFKTTQDAINEIQAEDLGWLIGDRDLLPNQVNVSEKFDRYLKELNGIEGLVIKAKRDQNQDVEGKLLLLITIYKNNTNIKNTVPLNVTVEGFKTKREAWDTITAEDLPWIKGDKTKIPSEWNKEQSNTIERKTGIRIKGILLDITFIKLENESYHINDEEGKITLIATINTAEDETWTKEGLEKKISGFKTIIMEMNEIDERNIDFFISELEKEKLPSLVDNEQTTSHDITIIGTTNQQIKHLIIERTKISSDNTNGTIIMSAKVSKYSAIGKSYSKTFYRTLDGFKTNEEVIRSFNEETLGIKYFPAQPEKFIHEVEEDILNWKSFSKEVQGVKNFYVKTLSITEKNNREGFVLIEYEIGNKDFKRTIEMRTNVYSTESARNAIYAAEERLMKYAITFDEDGLLVLGKGGSQPGQSLESVWYWLNTYGTFRCVSKIKGYAFEVLKELGESKKLVLPICEEIGSYAFKTNKNLESIEAPKLKKIDEGAFRDNLSFTEINLPELFSIGKGAFRYNETFVEINLPNCNNIEQKAFYTSKYIEKIILPKVEYIEDQAFYNMIAADTLIAPNLVRIGNRAFRNWDIKKSLSWYDLSSLDIIHEENGITEQDFNYLHSLKGKKIM